tara:strand:- start:2059 stop:2613 length:555 start_codon:yes stop_codon:yes gene_type:complete
MRQLVSCAELARIKGVSKPAVAKAIKSGRIAKAVVHEKGKLWVNLDLALELWGTNTAIKQAAVTSKPVVKPVAITAQNKKELKKQVSALPDDQIPEYNVSRSRKEHYLAELAKIQVAQQKKELVSAKDVEKKSFELAVGIREALLTLPDRVSNLFASETDATAIDSVLRQEIFSCLERFKEGVA